MKEFKFMIDGTDYAANVEEQENGSLTVIVNGKAYKVELPESKPAVRPVVRPAAAPSGPVVAAAPAPRAAVGGNAVVAPLPGTVTQVLVKVGDTVKNGQCVLKLEAMKMENDITAESDGTVKAVHVAAGAQVQGGDALIELA